MGAGEAFGFFVLTLYIFLGIAIICDEWFVPSLERISGVLNLSADVAGATFLAAGSSAPELFTSVADTFGPGNNIGIGTIVGSAMFNILIIVALSAAATSERLSIDWRPVVRDCGFYASSICLLALFFIDGLIEWWESLLMVMGYASYILFMAFNERILSRCGRSYPVLPLEAPPADDRPAAPEAAAPPLCDPGRPADEDIDYGECAVTAFERPAEENEVDFASPQCRKQGAIADASDVKSKIGKPDPHCVLRDSGEPEGLAGAVHIVPNGREADPASAGCAASEPEEGYFDRFAFPADDAVKNRVLWVLSLPYYVAFTVTIPDCTKPVAERYFVLTFAMSICWIAVLCAGMVTSAMYIGCIVGIGPYVMGNLVVAIGTSVPDALGSMIVARDGEADMAIANAVGSNVFDVLLGLGLPWFFKSLVDGQPVVVDKCGVELGVIILVCTVALYFAILIFNRWKMDSRLGMSFLFAYAVYFLYTLLAAKGVLPGERCAR